MNIVISLGGSVLGTGKKELSFLKSFIQLIKKYSHSNKFVIYCGGGDIARKFIEYGKQFGLQNISLDWIGIYATRLNAILLKNVFGNHADKDILIDPTKKVVFKKSIKIASGWKPGWSTDYDAVLVAKQIKAKKVINITNISHAYTKDPKKFPNAKKIKEISWKNFRKLVGDKWHPGLSMPFDPIASREAQKQKLQVIIINNDIKKLKNVLDGKKVDGTIIY